MEMRLSLKAFVIFILYISTSSRLQATEALALDELPELVRNRNHSVHSSQKDLAIAEDARNLSRRLYLPQLELNGQYTRLNDDITIDIPPQHFSRDILNGSARLEVDIDPPPVKVKDKLNGNLHFLLKQPLYTGGRISAKNEAQHAEIGIQKAQLTLVEQSQLMQAIHRYYQIKLSEKLLESFAELKKRLHEIHKKSQVLISSGMAPKYSSLRTEVALAELNAKVEEAEASRQVLVLALGAIFGGTDLSQTSFKSPLKILSIPQEEQYWLELALSKRPEFQIAEERKKQAQALRKAAQGKMLPEVFAFGKYELLEDQLTMLEPKWAIGVGFSLELSAALNALPERRQASNMIDKANIALERMRKEIPLQVEQAFARVKGSKAALLSVEKALELSREALRISEIGFASGKTSYLDVLSHFNDLEKLEVRRWQIIEEYNRHVLELHFVCSSLTEYLNLYHANEVI